MIIIHLEKEIQLYISQLPSTLLIRLQQRNNRQYLVTIPKSIASALQWTAGTRITFSLTASHTLVLEKKKSGSVLQYPNKTQYLLTLPKHLVEALGWQPGNTLECSLDGLHIGLRRIP